MGSLRRILLNFVSLCNFSKFQQLKIRFTESQLITTEKLILTYFLIQICITNFSFFSTDSKQFLMHLKFFIFLLIKSPPPPPMVSDFTGFFRPENFFLDFFYSLAHSQRSPPHENLFSTPNPTPQRSRLRKILAQPRSFGLSQSETLNILSKPPRRTMRY